MKISDLKTHVIVSPLPFGSKCAEGELTIELQSAQSAQSAKRLSNKDLYLKLRSLVSHERKLTVEIIELIREVDQRRLYLEYGYTSLFSFVTDELGYTAAAAQRRIDAARVLQIAPEIKRDLAVGDLNLMQVAVMAQAVRQKQKEEPNVRVSAEAKKEMLQMIKGHDLKHSQQVIAEKLDLEIKEHDITRVQKDGSVRKEITFSDEQMKSLTRVRELISHINPNPSMAELIEFLAQEYLKRHDPLLKVVKTRNQRPSTLASGREKNTRLQSEDREQGQSQSQSRSRTQTQISVSRKMRDQDLVGGQNQDASQDDYQRQAQLKNQNRDLIQDQREQESAAGVTGNVKPNSSMPATALVAQKKMKEQFYFHLELDMRHKASSRKQVLDSVLESATEQADMVTDQKCALLTERDALPDNKTNHQESVSDKDRKNEALKARSRYIPVSVRRAIFKRDQCCQWVDPKSGKKCGSRFQLEVDHKKPVWAGGGGAFENLQLLCSAHNRLKYRNEAGLRWIAF